VNKDDHLIFESLKNRVIKKNDDEEGDLMTHMKEKGMISKDARVTLPAHKTEEEENAEQRLDPKCWKGYHKQGTKMKGGVRVNNCVKSEDAEDMSKSPFHYDPMHGLARAAHQIKDVLQSAANDEATAEHIEKMAEIILGPQSAYESYEQYERVLKGVMELLNHYVVVQMN